MIILLGILGTSCSGRDALVLSLQAPPGVLIRSYAVQVQDRGSRRVVYYSGIKQLDMPRDLSTSPLRMGLEFDQQGAFLVHVRAARIAELDTLPHDPEKMDREPEYFFATVYNTFTLPKLDALLLPVPPQFDRDRDHFPDAVGWLASDPQAAELYAGRPEVLDCVDQQPLSGNLIPPFLRASDIHPLARPLCNIKIRPGPTDPAAEPLPFEDLDLTCGGQPRTCEDADGDGDPAETDCDDYDPNRYHGNPRPRNCCQCANRQECEENHNKIADLSLCEPARCGTSFDYDCTGQSVNCFIDNDCDGYAENDPDPKLRDCDDNDVRVHPGAQVICDPAPEDTNKDWACDGNPRKGCVPCDLDGDGFQRDSAMSPDAYSNTRCPSDAYKDRFVKKGLPVPVDCDDNDRGVFPGASTFTLPSLLVEDLSKTSMGGTVAGALRGLCRNTDLNGAPQDTNCDGTPRRGCPAKVSGDPTCDEDGDGFPSAACKTRFPDLFAMVEADCVDDPRMPEAAQIFPGAPLKCPTVQGDRNCDGRSDICGTDLDLDGYDANNDCDDRDPFTHPFASEVCDGRDNDCDGLIDELNPDDQGRRMVETLPNGRRAILSCNDSNKGLCKDTRRRDGAQFTGRCVCTAFIPKSISRLRSTADPDRARCPGEPAPLNEDKDSDRPAPRCFDAYQPLPQTCDATRPVDDDCDGRIDDPEGRNLKEKRDEVACGRSVGECRAGKVVGCDRSRLNPFSRDAGRNVPGFDERGKYYVCDDKTVPPRDELCNGKDDDCDGALPGPTAGRSRDEVDADGDLYMSCSSCDPMNLGKNKAGVPLQGCNDCADGDRTIYPGAPELCDGKDNACKGNFTPADDGVGFCKDGTGPACCARQCVDLKVSFDHCGSCNNKCSPRLASRCVDGKCQCNDGDPCDPMGSKPVCKDDSGCVECLADNDCAMKGDRTHCETTRNKCVQCRNSMDCNGTTPYCLKNVCVECTKSAECTMDPKRKVCSDSNRCVECLVAADCGTRGDACDNEKCQCNDGDPCDPMGGKPVCKAAMGCVECLNDGHCGAGKKCMDNECK